MRNHVSDPDWINGPPEPDERPITGRGEDFDPEPVEPDESDYVDGLTAWERRFDRWTKK